MVQKKGLLSIVWKQFGFFLPIGHPTVRCYLHGKRVTTNFDQLQPKHLIAANSFLKKAKQMSNLHGSAPKDHQITGRVERMRTNTRYL